MNSVCWPRIPYRVAKVFLHWATVDYRESYGLCASNGTATSLPDCEGAARNKAGNSRCQGAINDSYRSTDSYDVV